MQSLSFKVFMDFNAGGTLRSCLANRDLEVGERRKGMNCRDHRRTCRIVACASGAESQSPSSRSNSFLSWTQSYALLKQQMEVAAKSEDYKEAARLRDSLKSFEEEEPILHFRRLLKEAIADERFEVPIHICRLCVYLVELPAPNIVLSLQYEREMLECWDSWSFHSITEEVQSSLTAERER